VRHHAASPRHGRRRRRRSKPRSSTVLCRSDTHADDVAIHWSGERHTRVEWACRLRAAGGEAPAPACIAPASQRVADRGVDTCEGSG
jgi:hypothetical protein